MNELKSQIAKVRQKLESVGICINLEAVHDAIDEALTHLTTIEQTLTQERPAGKELREAVERIRFLIDQADKYGVKSETPLSIGDRRCLETLITHATAQEWMPIEECTMPKDNEIVLLAWKSNIKPHIANNAHLPDWVMEVGRYCTVGTHGHKSWHGHATHWKHLDTPPTATHDTEKE